MENEFATEDIRNVFSKIMKFMEESSDSDKHNESVPELLPPPKKKSKSNIKPEKKITVAKIEKPEKSEQAEKKTKKISAGTFQNTTYARMIARQQVVEEKLKKNAKAVEDKTFEEIKAKPDINKNSKIKVNLKPICERYENIIEDKKKKIDDLTEKIKKTRNEMLEKELTFHPNIEKSQDIMKLESSDVLFRMKEWEEKKNLKASLKKDEIEEKMKEILTFKPNLCENSVKLAAEHHEQKDVALRLFEYKKTPVNYDNFTFTPNLSKGTQKLARTRSEAHVFSRLYKSNKEQNDLPQSESPI